MHPNCEICGTCLQIGEILDNGYQEYYYYENIDGYCPCCGQKYSWTEIFTSTDIKNLQKEN